MGDTAGVKDSELGFARNVCGVFGLDPDGVRISSLPGSINRLWALRTVSGRFVVKEFAYDDEETDKQRGKDLARAAEFEYGLWATGQLIMPEPVRAADGQLIRRVTGTRESTVAVRVHRHLDGAPIAIPVSASTAHAAGAALATIQRSGTEFETTPSGSLRWWTAEPATILHRLSDARMLTRDQAGKARAALEAAYPVIAAGDELPGQWVFTHCDHKPENSLLAGGAAGQVAVLDWDEAGPCHPRLEAVESALRWAGVLQGEPSPGVFRSFLVGYEPHGGQIGPLHRADFAKWVSALAGWFSLSGRRALGDLDDTKAEQSAAATMTVESISALHHTLARMDRWVTTLAAPVHITGDDPVGPDRPRHRRASLRSACWRVPGG